MATTRAQITADIATHAAASDPHTGYALESALQGLSFQNEVMNFPSIERAENTQPEWWDEADANATLTEVDPPGESITENSERCLKVVVATANSYAYQRYTYDNQPRLKSGRTVSCAVAVWSVSNVNARVRLQSSVGSLGVSATTTAAAWTVLKVEAVVLSGTYVELRMEVDVGTAYFVPLGLHIGSMALSLEKPRGLRYRRPLDSDGVLVEDLAGSTGKAFADIDVTAASSTLAVIGQFHVNMFEGSAGEEYDYFTRRNGSAGAATSVNKRGNVKGDLKETETNAFTEILDANQVLETQLTRAAGAGSLAVCQVYLDGWWEWE